VGREPSSYDARTEHAWGSNRKTFYSDSPEPGFEPIYQIYLGAKEAAAEGRESPCGIYGSSVFKNGSRTESPNELSVCAGGPHPPEVA
jgi:hypothetical protein